MRQPRGVHLIVGPTGLGKTAAAIGLARTTGAPIVVADRIQCYTDLAVGSARDCDQSTEGVSRYLLCDRTVDDGDYPSGEATEALVWKLGELCALHPLVIVEGGSMSMMQDFAQRWEYLPFRMSCRLLHIGDHLDYLGRLSNRARRMLVPAPVATGMLDELAALWRRPEHRPFAASLNGYDAIIEWCSRQGVAIESLTASDVPEAERETLVSMVARRHAEHGSLQEDLFGRRRPRWRDAPREPPVHAPRTE